MVHGGTWSLRQYTYFFWFVVVFSRQTQAPQWGAAGNAQGGLIGQIGRRKGNEDATSREAAKKKDTMATVLKTSKDSSASDAGMMMPSHTHFPSGLAGIGLCLSLYLLASYPFSSVVTWFFLKSMV